MSLGNIEYFVGDVALPGLTKEGLEDLQSSVDENEDEALLDIFGHTLYELYKTNPSEQRFVDLNDGKEFSFDFDSNTVTRKFKGLSDPKSLLVYYTYYKYRLDNYTETTRVGEAATKAENSTIVTPRYKILRAWNNYVEKTGLIPDKIRIDGVVTGCDLFDKYTLSNYIHYDDKPSIYNFLLANKDIYPEWEYNNINKQKNNVFNF